MHYGLTKAGLHGDDLEGGSKGLCAFRGDHLMDGWMGKICAWEHELDSEIERSGNPVEREREREKGSFGLARPLRDGMSFFFGAFFFFDARCGVRLAWV